MDQRLVCLLPARNAAEDLPGYFESVAGFADGVVALDDGSTDETRELLEASPLVKVLLSNPRRESYRGWDDGKNRNRLLAAAGELDPVWIISLDADERIDPEDAAALRTFIQSSDAIPACGFGLQHYWMWGDAHHYPTYSWIYRLFGFRTGQRFPDRRLHFQPLPIDIAEIMRVKTTVRVQHFGAASPRRRQARCDKYREADPGGDYPDTLEQVPPSEPHLLARWGARPEGCSILMIDGL